MIFQIISSAKFKSFFDNCNFLIYEKSQSLIKLQKKKLKKKN